MAKKQYSVAEKKSYYNGKKQAYKEIARKAGVTNSNTKKATPAKKKDNVFYLIKK